MSGQVSLDCSAGSDVRALTCHRQLTPALYWTVLWSAALATSLYVRGKDNVVSATLKGNTTHENCASAGEIEK